MALLLVAVSSLVIFLLELGRVRRHSWEELLTCGNPLTAERFHVV